jgi:chromosome condensin MukBEF complex kleisin-like MukF subunit
MKQFSTREDAIAKVMEPCKDWAEALYNTELKLAETMELLREYRAVGQEIIEYVKE